MIDNIFKKLILVQKENSFLTLKSVLVLNFEPLQNNKIFSRVKFFYAKNLKN